MASSVNKILEKDILVDGIKVHYLSAGEGKSAIVMLHGWGVSSKKYAETAENMLMEASRVNCGIRILIPDLPGFGKSEEPKENWDLDDYVTFIDSFINIALKKSGFEKIKIILSKYDPLNRRLASESGIKSLNKNKFILVGHSFGGRIAIKYAAKYPEKISGLILAGAAGIKHPLSLRQKIFYFSAKTGKILFMSLEAKLPIRSLAALFRKILYKLAREKDYYNASPRMKEIMKNVIREDLAPLLSKIDSPTLLVWGGMDKSTPLSDGMLMREKIKNSELATIANANHGLPYKKPKEFSEAVIEFVKKCA